MNNIILYKNCRITVILAGVIRVEYSKNKKAYTDCATQKIWYRERQCKAYKKIIDGDKVIINTEKAEICVNCRTGKLVYSKVGSYINKGSNRNNLKGTTRTLDQSFGRKRLDEGVLSLDGTAILDDSDSLLIKEDDQICSREYKEKDYYIFAYGNDYIGAVKALYEITGKVPLIPRYALGNWWSRYKAYTQDEYKNLILKFEEENVPLSVATVDMDWHWVNLKTIIGEKKIDFGKKIMLGKGWTGYSWNTELFPDYKGFLKFLKECNLKVTLNLHPASGVRCFEKQYEEMAKSVGMNPESKKAVPFDITDEKFREAYFKYLHHPYEMEGVDFWWIDWQQGKKSAIKGLDPLWALNHYHYIDGSREGKRPLILSRYAGIGSHRYPLGFSGDTWVTWAALKFQPYFTATAANCGYTWWSHDIGGHMFEKNDDELYVRWIQFGVFSPIMRLHSNNVSKGKEPWKYGEEARKVAVKFLRLRNRLVPYIYTMNYRTYTEGRALCEPLYYSYKEKQAYAYENEYFFGTELLVCPVTSKRNRRTKKAKTKMYLPQGRWTNVFTGESYEGKGDICVESSIEEIPVFAKEGAIIPMSLDAGNGVKNPEKLQILMYRGNGEFCLYEDDGETNAYKTGAASITRITQHFDGKNITVEVQGGKNDKYMPEQRTFSFVFADIADVMKVKATVNGENVVVHWKVKRGSVCVDLEKGNVDDEICIILNEVCEK